MSSLVMANPPLPSTDLSRLISPTIDSLYPDPTQDDLDSMLLHEQMVLSPNFKPPFSGFFAAVSALSSQAPHDFASSAEDAIGSQVGGGKGDRTPETTPTRLRTTLTLSAKAKSYDPEFLHRAQSHRAGYEQSIVPPAEAFAASPLNSQAMLPPLRGVADANGASVNQNGMGAGLVYEDGDGGYYDPYGGVYGGFHYDGGHAAGRYGGEPYLPHDGGFRADMPYGRAMYPYPYPHPLVMATQTLYILAVGSKVPCIHTGSRQLLPRGSVYGQAWVSRGPHK